MSELGPFLEVYPFENKIWKSCVQDISKSIWARAFIFGMLVGAEEQMAWSTFQNSPSNFDKNTELWNFIDFSTFQWNLKLLNGEC